MIEDSTSTELLLFTSFTRLLYNSYKILNEINYYENANHEIKLVIKNDFKKIQYYNKCCEIFFKNDENFCGRFSIHYLKIFNKIIDNKYEYILSIIEDDELFNFFLSIFHPILKNIYDRYIINLKIKNENILNQFISKKTFNENCSICMESLNDKNKKNIHFDCDHKIHYDCILDWFMENQSCPICRKKF